VSPDPSFSQSTARLTLTKPASDPASAQLGDFNVEGNVTDPAVTRVVVNTVDAALADPPVAGGPRTFRVKLKLRPGINPIVATPFDDAGGALDGSVAARVVVLGPPAPFEDPGTITTDFAGNGGYVLLEDLPGALDVNVSVQDTTHFDAIFVNGQSVSAKVCPIGTNPANQSCGWSGTGTATVAITQPVQSVVATAIDTDPGFQDFVGVNVTDISVRDGLVAAIGRSVNVVGTPSQRLQLYDASSLARIADVPAGGGFRVSLAPRVSVDLDLDGRTGDAENRDGDAETSWDELRSIAIVGGNNGLQLFDVTDPTDPQAIGPTLLASSVGSTFKAFTLRDKDIAYVAADTRVLVIDLRRAAFGPALSPTLSVSDSRILQSIPIPGGAATDVVVDEKRRLLYVLQEGIGVRIFQLGCDQDVGVDATHRPVPLENPFNSDDNLRSDIQFALQRGLGEQACNGFTLTPTTTASAAFLAQGSSACLWREDGICGSAFQRANSDYDFHLVFEDPSLASTAPGCAAAIERSILDQDAQGDPLPPLPHGSVFRDVTVFPVPLEEMAVAYRESAAPCGAPGDPDGDLCLGRTGLMLKWFLESEFVYGAAGPSDRFDLEFDLESGLRQLAKPRLPDDAAFVQGNTESEPTHIPLAEGLEWACQAAFNFEKSGARFRIAGAGPPGASGVEWPFFLNEIHKVGKAAIRAVYGRLLADPATNRLLLTTSRRDFNSGSGCNTAFTFANGALPTSLADFGYKRCESFEEYVASVAIQSVKRGLGPLSGADALLAFEMFRMKSDVGPAIADEAAANAFVLRARDLIARIENATDVNQSYAASAPRYIDFSERQQNFQQCQNRTAQTKAEKTLDVPLRAFNGAYVAVPEVTLKAYQDGGVIQGGERQIGLVGGEDRLIGRKTFHFGQPAPGQLSAAEFVIDPENELTEYDKDNNHSGFFYYYLEDGSNPTPPSTPNGSLDPPLPPGVNVPLPRSLVCAAPTGQPDPPVPGLEFSLSTAALPFGTNGLPGRGSAANREGQDVELRWTIANTGNVDLANIVIETSVPCVGGAPSIGTLAAGASVTPTCRVTVPPGGALVLSTITADTVNGVGVGASSAAVEIQAIDPGEPQLDPVIFVPGMAGSVLRDGGPNGDEHWPGGSKEELSLDPRDPDFIGSIVATDAMRSISIAPLISMDIYGKFLEAFTQGNFGHELYTEYAHQDPISRTPAGCIVPGPGAPKPTLFVYPWDWRAGVEPAVQGLDDYVKCVRLIHGPGARIHMVGHSMGGLVARRYVLTHPDEISRVVTLGTPYLGAPKGTYVMQTGDFIGVPGVVQAVVLIRPGLLRSLAEFFPGAHELLPSASYFDFVDPLPAPVGSSPFATAAGDANHDEFQHVLDVALYPSSRPVARNMALHGLPGMADWTDESVQSLYHIVYGADSQKTIQKVRIVNRALLRFLVGSGSSLVGDAVSAEANPIAGSVAEQAVQLGSGFLLPVDDTQTETGLHGDGTVPTASSIRIQPPNPGTSPNLVNLNAPTAELWRVPATLKQDHNGMLGESTVQKYVLSVLQPHRVTLTVPERRTACAASHPTVRDVSNDSGCLPE
jgi:pimeloyl-ACP methyl ester carboxylesterase